MTFRAATSLTTPAGSGAIGVACEAPEITASTRPEIATANIVRSILSSLDGGRADDRPKRPKSWRVVSGGASGRYHRALATGATVKGLSCQQLRQLGKNGSVEETDACFIVKDHAGHSLAYVYFEEERRSLLAGFPHAWLNRQSSDSRHSPWRGNAYGGAVRVAQEEAVKPPSSSAPTKAQWNWMSSVGDGR